MLSEKGGDHVLGRWRFSMQLRFASLLGVLMLLLAACDQEPESPPAGPDLAQQFFKPDGEVRLSRTEALYVPVYSSISLQGGKRQTEMAATLAIHNTDREKPIFVTRVAYYDTRGQLLETYLQGTFGLPPLAFASIFITESDTRGGFGANFIVEWGAEGAVSDPIIETITVGSSGTWGFSFTNPGKVIAAEPEP